MNQLVENYLKLLENNKPQPKVQRVVSPKELRECWVKTGLTKVENYEYNEIADTILKICFAPDRQSKGAVICGSKGIGKTLNMDIFAAINTHMFGVKTKFYEVGEIELMYKLEGANFLESLTDIPCLIINDAGAENLLNDFGTHRNIISDILILRYRAFQKRGLKTYLTSNMTWKAINEHYGDRLEDRFKEMFYKVEIVGESKR
jgi:DNA replication protein DnaC